MADRDPLPPETEGGATAAARAELEERLVDRRLQRMFGELARPQLSPFFEAHLRQRLARERRQRLMQRCSRVMAVYWLTVALASWGILHFLPWPSFMVSGTLQAALVLALVAAVAPVWVLLRVLGAGLMDTIVGTLEPGGSQADGQVT